MIRLLQILFVGHFHKWKTIRTAKIRGHDKDVPAGFAYIQECEHCGKVIRRDLT